MVKNKFKIGTIVNIKKKYINWSSDNIESLYTANGKLYINSIDDAIAYNMWKFSKELKLDITGIIIDNNGYKGECFAYIVWASNELGSDILYLEPRHLELLN